MQNPIYSNKKSSENGFSARGFFSRFSADFGKFIFRNLEFREKSLSLGEKSLSLEKK